MILLFALGCAPPDDGSCEAAAERLGELVCVHAIEDLARWDEVAREADAIDQDRMTKWAAPYGPDSPLADTLFLNSNVYPLHWELLRAAFPDRFPAMTLESYSAMVLDPDEKVLESGNLASYIGPDGDFFGFTIWDDRTQAGVVTYPRVLAAWEDLSARFGPAELVFVPNTTWQSEAAASWTDRPFAVRGLD